MFENLPTLGRPVSLGGLYSGKGGNFLPGPSFSPTTTARLSFLSFSLRNLFLLKGLSQFLYSASLFLLPLFSAVVFAIFFHVSFPIINPCFWSVLIIVCFLSGFSFWNEDTVEEQKITKKKLYTNTAIQADNNLLDRISVFKMDAEQKLSYLGGLIDVKG